MKGTEKMKMIYKIWKNNKELIFNWLSVIPMSIVLMIPILNCLIVDNFIYEIVKDDDNYGDLFGRIAKEELRKR